LVGEDPRPGQTSTSTNDDHVGRVLAVIRENCHLTVPEVANKVGISIGSCHQIFTEKPQMCRISAKFVPRLLADDQKQNPVEIYQELLANANGNCSCKGEFCVNLCIILKFAFVTKGCIMLVQFLLPV